MCGISGKLSFNGSRITRELIKKMNDQIVHRGPDDEGIYVDKCIGLGQQRLSINDLRPEATAPITNEDGTLWLVFNGEIYNFKELRQVLESKGHFFKTSTDTEVIVHAYEEYGYRCLDYFNGMFAFALWDSRKEELFCARDRLGKKPFCYSVDQNSFIFGSEIKSIQADPTFHSRPDYSSIETYLSYGYIPAPFSAFKGVKKLQAGHFLVCNKNGQFKIERYWQPPLQESNDVHSLEEIRISLKQKLEEAVKLRMVSDVPIGALLSGGIDSTAVVALMAQQSDVPIKTFSMGFEGDEKGELPYAKLLSERYGTQHHEFIVEPNAAEVLPLLVKHYNEPFSDSSAIPTYYISKYAREHVTVALTGDGGDESFAGYTRYVELRRWYRMAQKYAVAKPLFNFARNLLKMAPYTNSLSKINRGLLMMSGSLPDMYRLQMTSGLKPEEKDDLYTGDFKQCKALQEHSNPISSFGNEFDLDAIEYAMRHDQTFYLPDCLMVKSDIASMANSLELRAPIMDFNLVEFAAQLPIQYRCNGSVGKWIMRETFKDLLPSEILNKPKTGFSLPLGKWLREDLNEMLRDYLLDSTATNRGIFDPKKVEKMIQQHEQGVRPWQNRLWNMLVLEIWFRECVDFR